MEGLTLRPARPRGPPYSENLTHCEIFMRVINRFQKN